MKARTQSGWFSNGLFWRTFFLLTFLITASMVAWVASFRMVERGPRAEQLAAQIVSVVTITRAALTHSAPEMRRELLFDLASNEGIRIYPLEKTDKIVPPEDSPIVPELEYYVRETLDENTLFASSVNDVEGFWISFNIDGDKYWLMLDRGRLDRTSSLQWLGWGSIALFLSLIGAVFISTLINQPLARLTAAARAIGKGRQPEPLPESGPTEIEEANRSFNQMVADINRVESDRALILAGISHDLRTPLARMQLEVEMANLSDESRDGMHSDLAQMDSIIGQFLDYAKPFDANSLDAVDISGLLLDVAANATRLPDVKIATAIAPGAEIAGDGTELARVFNNLVENARRYGKTPGTDCAEIDLRSRIEAHNVVVEIADHGPGVPDSECERLLRPFTRLDTARGQANGSGLGLAIVNRIVLRHNGKLVLKGHEETRGGLVIQITLPLLHHRRHG
ncbi:MULTISPECIES: sensor histidine kinase [unclassified Herbaspirillum]|uniref:sensor histidine kinase n=1 Tax=unclassified Herbaspirillum TaxID=2624150 RepID=UPI001151E22C|nr:MULTISPECIES: sensor histidine kinase [unclassified Herbaspirillum]MBB5393066.1 two-component system osmolarity sensor histidine kinase EnvZ [Herbaspirillum sp. SJZ102]TQK04291.1 two-component system osmolarity sensor histidine kinase EnvZ [Herbaspirillum sp. SJZ130]TQK09924.1 two-component system osmolarity sensor histidine kinase EnvZ [Herbaspirillum sp. SJZ106]TWC65753.1 two-component system osmolarity sensor histidine kinase EnvZ [Herbaspirillum sp. SJZ099]